MNSLVSQILVFIGSAIILVPIFQRLRFGSVLGYLMAGIIVGPYGLKLIHDAEHVSHFSEFGVVFLLFMIGLEIRLGKLWSMRKHLFGLGGTQVVSATAIFALIGFLVGLEMVPALILGFALSLSSTAFALQTLNERNQFNTEFGRSSFSILLMQDLAAIPALAFIPLAATGATKSQMTWMTAVYVVLIVGFLVLASRYLIRPAFRIIAATRTREIFTAATLFIVMGVAALMQQVGLSAALGTFLAGVLMADSEYRHEIEADLEPFKSLLMGLFFISVGMGVSLPTIAAQPGLVIGLSVAYLFIKALLIFSSGKLFGLSTENSKMMALTIAQGGEFAFVIFGMATQFSLANSETIVILTAVITISMALSPVMNVINDKLTLIRRNNQQPNYDQIQGEHPDVIIAGLGRFGQIFGRILRAQGIPFVAIDHDSEQIEQLRRFGNKVYYGDSVRLDILEAAGAHKAKYFVLAIDDVEASIETAKTIVEHFPNLKVFARARNRAHTFDLMALGVKHIKRETLDSSLNFVRDLFVEMGMPVTKAMDITERFREHDEIMLAEQFKVRHDDDSFISVSKQGAAQFAQVLSQDSMGSYVKVGKSDQPKPN